MSGLSDERLAELAAAAEAATPGPWHFDPDPDADVAFDGAIKVRHPEWGECEVSLEHVPNRAHIAAFDPPTALALVAEVQRLRAVVAARLTDEAVCDLADFIAEERDKYPRRADDMDSQELATAIADWLAARAALVGGR